METELAVWSEIKVDNPFLSPAFAAISFYGDKRSCSVGYANFSSARYYSQFEIITVDQPTGTGVFSEAFSNINTHTFFLAGYVALGKKTNIGLSLGLNYLRHRDLRTKWFDGEEHILKGDGFGAKLIIGLTHSLTEKFNFAAVFRHNAEIKYNVDGLGINSINGNRELVETTWPHKAVYPEIFEFECRYTVSEKLNIAAKLSYEKWSSLHASFENVLQFHAGGSYAISEKYTILAGYFTQMDPSELFGNYYDQRFFTTGLHCQISNKFRLTMAILDSHLLSSKQPGEKKDLFKQTYFSLGISVF